MMNDKMMNDKQKEALKSVLDYLAECSGPHPAVRVVAMMELAPLADVSTDELRDRMEDASHFLSMEHADGTSGPESEAAYAALNARFPGLKVWDQVITLPCDVCNGTGQLQKVAQ
jgi:hypothetical protein